MNIVENRPTGSQMRLLQDEPHERGCHNADCCSLLPGKRIVYVGRVGSSLQYGDMGVVLQALRNRAVVDMGPAGTWQLPYYVLRDAVHRH